MTGAPSDRRSRSALRCLGDVLAPDGPVGGAAPENDVLALAERTGLLPAVRSALVGAGLEAEGRLRSAHVHNLARNLALVDQATELLGALEGAGIPAAPLKGIDAVLTELYGDWGARTMGDLDLLVDPAAGEAAAEVLSRIGYVPIDEELPGHHHLTPMTAPGRVGPVEIHIGLLDRPVPGFLEPRELLARASPDPDRPGLRLDRTDAATHLVDHAQHAAPAHRLVVDLRALHETALVVHRVPEVDWDLVRHRFDRAGIVERLDAHLALTAEVFHVPPPVPVRRAGRWVARLELFVEDHPRLGVLDHPGRRLAKLRRPRLERYYGVPLPGTALWRARGAYLREVVTHRRSTVRSVRGRSSSGGGPLDVPPPS